MLDGAGAITLALISLLFVGVGYILAALALNDGIKVILGFLVICAIEAGIMAIIMAPIMLGRLIYRHFKGAPPKSAYTTPQERAKANRLMLITLGLFLAGALMAVVQYLF